MWQLQDYWQHKTNARAENWSDSLFVNLILIKSVSISGSAICIILNTLLIYFILSSDEFRDLKFFPVGFQALIDILGPGVSNIAYEIVSYERLHNFRYQEIPSYMSMINLDRFSRVGGLFACILTYFRTILNEYTTGYCILASAFVRYCLICRPTSEILTKNRLKAIMCGILIISLLAILSNFADMIFNFHPHEQHHGPNYQEIYLNTKLRHFLYNCEYPLMRHGARLYIDAVVSFIVPNVLSGALYANVALALKKREKNQERNRNLTIAFTIGWILWILFWVPFYYAMWLRISFDNTSEFEDSPKYHAFKYLIVAKTSVILMYSHSNPLIILVVLKSFRKMVQNTARLLFMGHEIGFGLKEKPHAQMNHIKKKVTEKSKNKSKLEYKKDLRIATALLGALLILTVFGGISSSATISGHSGDLILSSRFKLDGMKGTQYRDIIPETFVPEEICGRNHGQIFYAFERCYFVFHHKNGSLNLTEQISECKARDAKLADPRNVPEIHVIWDVYLEFTDLNRSHHIESGNDMFLHVGLTKTSVFFNESENRDIVLFSSVDRQQNFTEITHPWLLTIAQYHFNLFGEIYLEEYNESRSFGGPAVCITFLPQALECLPQYKRAHSVCSVDLNKFAKKISI